MRELRRAQGCSRGFVTFSALMFIGTVWAVPRDYIWFLRYAPDVTWAGKTSLGVHGLGKVTSSLKVEVVDRNPDSKGILVGIDCLTLRAQ